ncbi:MAG: sulfatase [Planctomycetota bacterium]|nr:sulfatase [Planctomycetota bacterium]
MPLLPLALLALVPLQGLADGSYIASPEPASEQPPDVLLVVVDDLGWHDVGFTGGTSHLTPRIDALAECSTVFDNAYSDAPNCAPTRASILSGQATARHGVLTVGSSKRGKREQRRMEPVANRRHLDSDQTTLADDLSRAGYRTVHVGKFHVGQDPLDYGFTDQVAGTSLGHPKSYRSPYRNPKLEDGPEGEYLTDRLVREATRFIASGDRRPLFMQMSFFTVHTPIQPRPDLLAASRKRLVGLPPRDQKYDAMVSAMDLAVGQVVDAFVERSRPLMIIFTSDNGGYGPLADNGPLRGSKGTIYEGGIRVPLAVKWPGDVGHWHAATPVILRDLVPTILEVTGASSGDRILDGRSLSAVRDEGTLEVVPLHWHLPVYLERDSSVEGPWRTTPVAACRMGRYKLIEFFETGALELYDLESDPSETADVSAEFPLITRQMHQSMQTWRSEVGAALPTPLTSTDATKDVPADLPEKGTN